MEEPGPRKETFLSDRKQGGRNISNDRYICLNVDNNPKPLAELRRRLNLNLAYLYEEASDRSLSANKPKDALAAARKALQYEPEQVDTNTGVAFLEYFSGNKDPALAEFLHAKRLDPDFKKQFDATISWTSAFKPILADKKFLDKLSPPQ